MNGTRGTPFVHVLFCFISLPSFPLLSSPLPLLSSPLLSSPLLSSPLLSSPLLSSPLLSSLSSPLLSSPSPLLSPLLSSPLPLLSLSSPSPLPLPHIYPARKRNAKSTPPPRTIPRPSPLTRVTSPLPSSSDQTSPLRPAPLPPHPSPRTPISTSPVPYPSPSPSRCSSPSPSPAPLPLPLPLHPSSSPLLPLFSPSLSPHLRLKLASTCSCRMWTGTFHSTYAHRGDGKPATSSSDHLEENGRILHYIWFSLFISFIWLHKCITRCGDGWTMYTTIYTFFFLICFKLHTPFQKRKKKS